MAASVEISTSDGKWYGLKCNICGTLPGAYPKGSEALMVREVTEHLRDVHGDK